MLRASQPLPNAALCVSCSPAFAERGFMADGQSGVLGAEFSTPARRVSVVVVSGGVRGFATLAPRGLSRGWRVLATQNGGPQPEAVGLASEHPDQDEGQGQSPEHPAAQLKCTHGLPPHDVRRVFPSFPHMVSAKTWVAGVPSSSPLDGTDGPDALNQRLRVGHRSHSTVT